MSDVDLRLNANLVLSAGAGSGKTHALVTIALGLYAGAGRDRRADAPRVWAVTFTEKAARELRDRVVGRVAQLADPSSDPTTIEPQLAAACGAALPPPPFWKTVLESLPLARVGTFHSLAGQILRAHAAEAGIDPRFEILDEARADDRLRRAIDEIIFEDLQSPSGDARELARRLGGIHSVSSALRWLHHKLAEEGREPASLLDDHFDGDRASETLTRAAAALRRALEDLDGTGVDRLRPAADALSIERDRLGTLDPQLLETWYPAVARIVAQPRGRGALPKAGRAVWNPIKQAWDEVQDALAHTREAEAGHRLVGLLTRARQRYAWTKRTEGALDFADLVVNARDLLRDDLDVRRRIKRGFDALLVDEFQDTNAVQFEFVHLLCERRGSEGVAAPSELPLEPASLCAVGDRKQSIYEFRGADVSLFQALMSRAESSPEYRLAALGRSWRSRPGLVEATNQVFGALMGPGTNRAPFEVAWDPRDALMAVRDPGEGAAIELVEVGEAPSSDDRRDAEASALAAEVRQVVDGGVRGGDVAVLLRATTHVDRYRRALVDAGLAVQVVGGRGLLATAEVRDAVALALTLVSPTDPSPAAAVLRSPVYGISDEGLVGLALSGQLRLDRPPAVNADMTRSDVRRVAWLVGILADARPLVETRGLAVALELVLTKVDLRPTLAASPGGAQALANLGLFIDACRDAPRLGVAEWLRSLWVRGLNPADREAPADLAAAGDPDAVRVLTIHASKGLEYEVVVVPEMASDPVGEPSVVAFERDLGLGITVLDPVGRRLRSQRAKAVAQRLLRRARAESLRLLYVAITRARERAILIGDDPKAPAHVWRRQLDPVLAANPDAISVRAPTTVSEPQATSSPEHEWVDPAALADAVRRAGVVRDSPSGLRLAVTSAYTLYECPRRYYLSVELGLEGRGPIPDAGEAADDHAHDDRDLERRPQGPDAGSGDGDARMRGVLAHALLEHVNLDEAKADPAAAVARAARVVVPRRAPDSSALADASARATRFLASPLGRELVSVHARDPRRVLREVPLLLEIRCVGDRPGALHVVGQVDALWIGDDGGITVVDYKLGRSRRMPASYHFQLMTYAVATRRVWGDVPIRAGVAWLGADRPTVDWLPFGTEDLEAHAASLRPLRGALRRGRAGDHLDLAWPRRPAASDCVGCPHQGTCWGQSGGGSGRSD